MSGEPQPTGAAGDGLRLLRALVSYDGTRYHGWQIQTREATVQGEVERALCEVTTEPVRIVGAGRTDAGVHALGQVFSFRSDSRIPAARLGPALNARLPPDIRVHALEEAPAGFSARFSARWRLYGYLLARRSSPFLFRRAYVPRAWPEAESMNQALAPLRGERDFRAFTSQKEGPFGCRLLEARWSIWEHGLVLRVRADRFLYRMVRVLAGTCLQIGQGRRPPEEMARILAAGDRHAAGPLVPAHGLYLAAVGYDPPWPGPEVPDVPGPLPGAWGRTLDSGDPEA
jgi:tRNA pseudouridine38-40 synthase